MSSRRRALGQHFLRDPRVVDDTLALAELEPGAPVLEIGPGRGALTDRLLAAGHPVCAVEIDPQLAQRLRDRRLDGLEVVDSDFLRYDVAAHQPEATTVVANLPYSTGTAILHKLVAERGHWRRVVVMVQREVAERVVADPGSRAYGRLSIAVQLFARTRFGFVVPPSAFAPPPKVDSAVLRMDLETQARFPVRDLKHFERVVRAAFSKRRKTLRNALAGEFSAAGAEAGLHAAEIEVSRRAETVSIPEFLRLAEALPEASASGDEDAGAS